MKRIRFGLICILAAMLLLTGGQSLAGEASAGEAYLERVAEQNEFGSVAYPVLTGYASASVQDAVNGEIFGKALIDSRLNTLNGLSEGGWGLNVDYRSMLKNDMLSVVFSAYGEMENGRMGQVYTTVNYNLALGSPITAADLFSDVEGAFAYMEQKLENDVQPLLSGYTENDILTPIPRDNFYLTPDYITFYYPLDQFSMLSGYSGGCSFAFYELKDYLQLSEGSVLSSLGAGDSLTINNDTAARVAESVSLGRLPGVEAVLGDSLMDRLNENRLLVDPDYYPGGRFFEVEAPEFRSIWLLTDALTESYDYSQVLGIRADRVNLFGIQPGLTTVDEWRAALGTPGSTTDLDESSAEDYRLSAGISDYYTYGEHTLLLHADEDSVLQSVQLLK